MSEQTITYRQAINAALREEMERDDKVILIGEDIAGAAHSEDPALLDAWGGAFNVTKGLLGQFGKRRVIDTPISESAIIGMAVGAAATGLRPVPELMYVDFIGVCLDQVINEAALMHYMSGGSIKVPLTIRTMGGAGIGAAAQHSNCLYSIFAHQPGLKCVAPSTPADAKGLLKAAIRDDNPVIFFEHKLLYNRKGVVPDGEYIVPIGKAAVVREGTDVTIIAISLMVDVALKAAEQLAKDGIQAEVIDLRSLAPLDEETILASLAKTGRFLAVDEDHPVCSMASELVALVAQKAFGQLKAAPAMVTPPPTPVPFSSVLEHAYMPQVKDVMDAVTALVPARA